MLPVGRLQDMVRNVASFGHSEIAVPYGPGDDCRCQAVIVGDPLRVARLQGRQGRQEAALRVHEMENIGDTLCRQLAVEGVLQGFVLSVGLGPTQAQGLALRVIVEMLELAPAQLALKGLPSPIQIGAQDIEPRLDGLAQPWDVEVFQDLGLPVWLHQLVAEAAVTETVVNRQFAGGKAFADLPIDPEFVTVPAQAGRIPGSIEVEEVLSQLLRYRVLWDFGDWALREALLAREHVPHPAECRVPRARRWLRREFERHRERTQVLFEPRRRTVNRLPAEFQLADGLFAQALAGREQRFPRQDREGLATDGTERRHVLDRLVGIEKQHAPHARRFL